MELREMIDLEMRVETILGFVVDAYAQPGIEDELRNIILVGDIPRRRRAGFNVHRRSFSGIAPIYWLLRQRISDPPGHILSSVLCWCRRIP